MALKNIQEFLEDVGAREENRTPMRVTSADFESDFIPNTVFGSTS